MHIALFSPGWPLKGAQNGIVTFVHCMAQGLTAVGHRVSIFAPASEGAQPAPGVHRVGWSARGWRDRLLPGPHRREDPVYRFGRDIASAMLDVHRRDPIDVIEMEESFGWFRDVERITGVPVLVKLHGPAFLSFVEKDLELPEAQAKIEREGQSLAKAGAIAAPSVSTLTDTLARFALTPRIREHVVNPVVIDAATPLWDAKTCDPDTILFVGRFDRRKGADILLQAFQRMAPQRPRLKLILVGPDKGMAVPSGPPLDFQSYCEANLTDDVRRRIEFRGSMPNSEVSVLRPRAAVTVVASRWENQGYAGLEAMLQGCPLVSSNAGGCPESIIHGHTGLLARSEDADDFCEKIALMLDDPLAAAAMGAAARQYVMQKHAVGAVVQQSLALYRRVIAAANP